MIFWIHLDTIQGQQLKGGIQNMRLASVDIGNDAIKAYTENVDHAYYIPNVISHLEERSIVEMEKNSLDALHVEVSSSALKNVRKVAVGKLASKQSVNDELTPDTDKANSEQAIILLLTTLALDAVENLPETEEDFIEANFLLSTGVPMNETKRGLNKEFKKKLRDGQHQVTFLNTPNHEGKTVRIRFENVLVNTEGFAAYIDLTSNFNGSNKNEHLINKDILINDIGGLSTDSAIISKNGEIDNEYSDGIKKGVSSSLDNIIKKVYDQYGYNFKSRSDLVSVITNQDPEEKNTVWINGQPQSIKEIVDQELYTLAREEYKNLKDIWRNVPNLRAAYNIGGGALVLKPYLVELNREESNFPLEFASPNEGVWMIARAYFKILLMYCKKKNISIDEALTTG